MYRCENYSTKFTGKIGRNIYPFLLAVLGPFGFTLSDEHQRKRIRAESCLNFKHKKEKTLIGVNDVIISRWLNFL